MATLTADVLHRLFEQRTAEFHDSLAVICGNDQVTYGDLNARSNKVAHALVERGVGPDSLVGVVAERGIDAITAYLGVLKAGGAYVPLDPHYPHDRLAYMIEDSTLAVVLHSAEYELDLRIEPPVVSLDALAWYPTHNLETPRSTSRNLAYVMYTSGSTGKPKGIMIEHRGVLRLIRNCNYADITSDDCVAHCASPSFDASTWEIWAALLNGARLAVIDQAVLMNPRELNRVLLAHHVTALWLTTGLFSQYVDHLAEAFSCLDYVITGGDVLDVNAAARALGRSDPPRHLINAYGPTETTTFATTCELNRGPTLSATRIGQPISNTTIHIVDDRPTLSSRGAVGEICIGGLGVARGYLNNPGLTAASFIADPFSPLAGDRMYRSGDLGLWNEDGSIEYKGRRDTQVKIRGFRIELAEIEHTLVSSGLIRQAAVVIRLDSTGQKQIVAYAVPLVGESQAASSLTRMLRACLSARLPGFSIPSAIVVLDHLPLTANGKVDRGALPDPLLGERPDQMHIEPEGALERTLARLWREVLGVGTVSRDDHFLELGGNSVSAIKLAIEIEREWDLSIDTHTILSTDTFLDLARRLAELGASQDRSRLPGAARGELVI